MEADLVPVDGWFSSAAGAPRTGTRAMTASELAPSATIAARSMTVPPEG